MLRRGIWAAVFLVASGISLSAQSSTPILSGGVQYLSTTEGGATVFQPIISPVVAVPLGDRWLIESRGTFDEVIFREDGASGPYHALTFSSVDYLQLDFVANSHMTVTVGEFLTPFNIYNERLAPVWIHNLADAPLIAGIGTRTSASSDGAMLRGVAVSKKDWELNYTAYFSALVNARQFGAGRIAGGRVGVFVPRTRLEVGMSYQRFLQRPAPEFVGHVSRLAAVRRAAGTESRIRAQPAAAKATGSRAPIASRDSAGQRVGWDVSRRSAACNNSISVRHRPTTSNPGADTQRSRFRFELLSFRTTFA